MVVWIADHSQVFHFVIQVPGPTQPGHSSMEGAVSIGSDYIVTTIKEENGELCVTVSSQDC